MDARTNGRTGGEILTDQLLIHGVRHVFCVPGESYLAVLDAFHDRDLAVTVCRQEGGAAFRVELPAVLAALAPKDLQLAGSHSNPQKS